MREAVLRNLLLAALLLAAVPATAQKAPMTAQLPPAPKAEQRPTSFEKHGIKVEDPYAWLRDKGYPKVDDKEVLSYLEAENAYFEAWKKPHAGLIDTLFEELKGRQKEDDRSVPVKDGNWLYWWAFQPGAQYRQWYRKPAAGGAAEIARPERSEAKSKGVGAGALRLRRCAPLLRTNGNGFAGRVA